MPNEEASNQEEITEVLEDTGQEDNQKEVIEDRVKALEYQLNMALNQLGQKKETKVETEELPEEVAQLLAKDPKALAKFIKTQTEKATRSIQSESQKQIWDRRAEDTFPAIKTNESFKREVGKKIQELLTNGEYKENSPQLVYRAAELASLKFSGKENVKKNTNTQTSLETQRTQKTSDQIGKKNNQGDDNAYVVLAKMAGMKNYKGKDHTESFKKFVEKYPEYEAPKGKKSRLVLGDE